MDIELCWKAFSVKGYHAWVFTANLTAAMVHPAKDVVKERHNLIGCKYALYGKERHNSNGCECKQCGKRETQLVIRSMKWAPIVMQIPGEIDSYSPSDYGM
jgi:hypothetical protein